MLLKLQKNGVWIFRSNPRRQLDNTLTTSLPVLLQFWFRFVFIQSVSRVITNISFTAVVTRLLPRFQVDFEKARKQSWRHLQGSNKHQFRNISSTSMSLLDELFGQILQSEESIKQRFNQLKAGSTNTFGCIYFLLWIPLLLVPGKNIDHPIS